MNEYVLGGDLRREPLRKIRWGKKVGKKRWGKKVGKKIKVGKKCQQYCVIE